MRSSTSCLPVWSGKSKSKLRSSPVSRTTTRFLSRTLLFGMLFAGAPSTVIDSLAASPSPANGDSRSLRSQERFLNRIREIESSGGKYLIGDQGRSRGPFHFHRATWRHVTQIRGRLGLSSVSYETGAMNEVWARRYAQTYITWLGQQLTAELGWCSEQSIYAAWNAGLSRVLAVEGDITRLNRTTVRKCLLLDATRVTLRP